jgi:hypothetical protein
MSSRGATRSTDIREELGRERRVGGIQEYERKGHYYLEWMPSES